MSGKNIGFFAAFLGALSNLTSLNRLDERAPVRARASYAGGKTRGSNGRVNNRPGPDALACTSERAKTFDRYAPDAPKKASRTRPAAWGQPPSWERA
jgi:hypothetical protein